MEERVSRHEIEAEDAVSLPNKEVLSLLDVNANVDLGLNLAAPVDLAAAANLNVAAPIEAAATANVLSPGAEAVGYANQHGFVDQTISGSAQATAPQHATVDQNSSGGTGTGTGSGVPANEPMTPPTGGTDSVHPVTGGPVPDPTATPGATSGGTTDPGSSTGGVVPDATGAAPAATDAAGNAAGSTTGGVDSLLGGGSLLDANVNIHANANLAAPIDGAVAANGNVAAPIDAAVAANVGSPSAVSEALAPQQMDVSQNLDHVTAEATATQNANVHQK